MKRIRSAINNKKAEGYIDIGVKIIIAVVAGALVLGGVFALFNSSVLPTAQAKVESLFQFGDELQNEAPTPEMISFKIEGNTYQAEKNMSWSEWLSSDYNKTALRVKGNTIGNSNYYVYLCHDKSVYCRPTDTIVEGCKYFTIIEFPDIPD